MRYFQERQKLKENLTLQWEKKKKIKPCNFLKKYIYTYYYLYEGNINFAMIIIIYIMRRIKFSL